MSEKESDMSKKKFVQGTVYPLDRDLTKQWFVKYNLGGDASNGKEMKAQIMSLPTEKERLLLAEKIIEKLKLNGWQPVKTLKKNQAQGNYMNLAFELLESRKGTLSDKSYETMYSHLKIFNAYCIEKKSKVVGFTIAEEFFDHLMSKALHPKTVNNYRITLHSIFAKLEKRKKVRKNPISETEKKKGESDCPNWFKEHEFERLEKYMKDKKPFLWSAARWVFYCLMRPVSTLRFVRVGDVDFSRWQVKLKYSNTKNSKSYWVRIPDELREELKPLKLHEYPPSYFLIGADGFPCANQVHPNFWNYNFKKVLADLGFLDEGYYFYCLKHTGFAHAYLNGVGLVELKEHAGHKDISETYKYMRRLGLDDLPNLRTKFKKLNS